VAYIELPEKSCEELLIELFQSIPELLNQLAPDGFNNSKLIFVFHPAREQQYKEYRNSRLALIRMKRVSKKTGRY